MKNLLVLLMMFITTISISAQEKKEEETAKPTYGVKVERKIDFSISFFTGMKKIRNYDGNKWLR